MNNRVIKTIKADILDTIIADAVLNKNGIGLSVSDQNDDTSEPSASCPEQLSYTDEEIEQGKALAILAYIPFLCFIPYLRFSGANRYAYDHGKQGVTLFLIEVLILICVIFWQAALFIASLLSIYGIISVISGRKLRIPVLYELACFTDHKRKKD
jgi:hypothetical protein